MVCRLGTCALTSRGFVESDFTKVVELIDEVSISLSASDANLDEVAC